MVIKSKLPAIIKPTPMSVDFPDYQLSGIPLSGIQLSGVIWPGVIWPGVI
ncbi:MAG: hypothetical protein ABJZ55_21445 [Fuerstiella sp.]